MDLEELKGLLRKKARNISAINCLNDFYEESAGRKFLLVKS